MQLSSHFHPLETVAAIPSTKTDAAFKTDNHDSVIFNVTTDVAIDVQPLWWNPLAAAGAGAWFKDASQKVSYAAGGDYSFTADVRGHFCHLLITGVSPVTKTFYALARKRTA